jgi:hypothetical protein
MVYAHVGKAGGGTLNSILSEYGLLDKFDVCHPKPCLQKTRLRHQVNVTRILVTVRDPVDRFVSAFNWRAQLLCRVDDPRVKVHGSADKDPVKLCDLGREKEAAILHTEYRSNADEFARSLCDGRGELSPATTAKLKQIRHMDSLTDHLGGKGILSHLILRGVAIYATVLEPSFNFDAQARATVKQIALDANISLRSESKHESEYKHNLSEILGHNTTIKLSPQGAACVIQHFRGDFETITVLRQLACRGLKALECRAAMQSILKRRLGLVEASAS